MIDQINFSGIETRSRGSGCMASRSSGLEGTTLVAGSTEVIPLVEGPWRFVCWKETSVSSSAALWCSASSCVFTGDSSSDGLKGIVMLTVHTSPDCHQSTGKCNAFCRSLMRISGALLSSLALNYVAITGCRSHLVHSWSDTVIRAVKSSVLCSQRQIIGQTRFIISSLYLFTHVFSIRQWLVFPLVEHYEFKHAQSTARQLSSKKNVSQRIS